jgi:hypothetical protein
MRAKSLGSWPSWCDAIGYAVALARVKRVGQHIPTNDQCMQAVATRHILPQWIILPV